MCLETEEKEIDNICYSTYERRLWSFQKWKGKLQPEQLAACGFYYLLKDDICKCFYCGVEIFQWEYNDCPIFEHCKYNKNCNLVECLNKYKDLTNTKGYNIETKLVYFTILVFVLDFVFSCLKTICS
jgi:hypothetical protein